MILKIGSALGRRFDIDALQHVYVELKKTPLEEKELFSLISAGILSKHLSSNTTQYEFQSALFHEVVYNAMLFSQRRQLHNTIAQYFEKNYQQGYHRALLHIVHHYVKAGRTDKASKYHSKVVKKNEINSKAKKKKDSLKRTTTSWELKDFEPSKKRKLTRDVASSSTQPDQITETDSTELNPSNMEGQKKKKKRVRISDPPSLPY